MRHFRSYEDEVKLINDYDNLLAQGTHPAKAREQLDISTMSYLSKLRKRHNIPSAYHLAQLAKQQQA